MRRSSELFLMPHLPLQLLKWDVLLYSHSFLSTERGCPFTRARSCHVTVCTVYFHEKLIARWKGKITVSFCFNCHWFGCCVWVEQKNYQQDKQTNRHNKNKHTCMANKRNESLMSLVRIIIRALRQIEVFQHWRCKMGWTHHMLRYTAHMVAVYALWSMMNYCTLKWGVL